MEIKKCTITEIDSVMKLINDAIIDMRAKGINQWDEVYPDIEVITEDISEGSLYGYYDEGLKGIMVLNENQDYEYGEVGWELDDERPLVIHRLCIHPNYQGRGIAKTMVKFAESYACNNNYKSIRLDSFTQNEKACSLYRALGYKAVGTVYFRKGAFYCFEKILRPC